ncbi:MAG TPA: gas vesicle protein GvpG [Longimicrobiaceae bacterium]
MGLLKHLLFWPVTGPEFLVKFSLDKVQGAVREQLTDDQSVKEDLMALQMRLELGEIDDEEYVALEAQLMERLRDVRRWREEFGMGTSGGPVQVARPTEPEEAEPEEPAEDTRRGGIASPDGASVEVSFEWKRDE